MGKAIGIDLGTTNSCAAIMDGSRPRVITQRGGNATIPSVFAIDEKGNRLVGQEAKRQAQLNPSNTVMAAKRLIGRNFHSKTIDKVRQIFTYEMLEGDNSEVLIKVKDQVFTLEQISAAILRRIKEVAEDALGSNIEQAVITVPAYFNDRQRQAVRNAGKLAGLKVLRILNEPTAAALAYGLGRNLSQRIAVYDLGGGTFDISVIDIKDRIFEVIATGGDTFLGGVDFDDRLMQHVLERFHQEHGIDLAWDRVAIQRIRDASETAKIELSSKKTTRIHIPYIAKGDDGPLDVDIQIGRERLEELTGDLVGRTVETCQRIFKEAGTGAGEIDEILLVGGQSRMPMVQQAVTEFAGKPPCKGVHPDEAVALGAAIMAQSLASSTGSNVTLLDVLPMPIGINKRDGTMHVLFQKNQPLPDYKTRTLTTSKDDQRSIMLRIYQGESRIALENELLGTFVFSGIRPAKRGHVQIEVTFHIDSEGILNLSARDKATGQTVESTLKLGMGKKRKKKKKKRRPTPPTSRREQTEKAAAPKPAAPSSLGMPRSSLAKDIGGAMHATPGDDDKTMLAGKPPDRLQPDGAKDSAPPSATPVTPQPTSDSASTPPTASTPSTAAPAGDIKKELAQARESAKSRKRPQDPSTKNETVLGKVMGWFKGLFGD
ncbi:MAG: Hsp70 family protein [Oligoflexia bacterium]|nr:Hsp70 family protein [Oligoflexia bacterium]